MFRKLGRLVDENGDGVVLELETKDSWFLGYVELMFDAVLDGHEKDVVDLPRAFVQ